MRLLLFMLIFSAARLWGQTTCPTGKEGNIWYFGGYFGDPAGLDFNTDSPPAYLGDCAIPYNQGYEAYAIASDADGNLLFYSNGDNVWNRNHELMPNNGFGIGGHPSATQIIALPQPGHPGIHYIFYPEALEQNPQADTLKNMYYSVVDMLMDGGLGDIVLKKILLHDKTTEKVAAARHCNGQDWWVLTHELGSNQFFAWLLDSLSIVAQPVVSNAGLGNSGIIGTKSGAMKISSNGQAIAMAEGPQSSLGSIVTFDAHIELFHFNNQTGEVSDPILLQDSLRSAYGAEFSPDNSKVYFKVWDPQERVIQYDLSIWDADSIVQSKTVVADVGVTTNDGGMALGPDGKIYVANANYFGIPQKSLDVIHQPNEKGAACQYQGGAQGLILPDSVGVGLGLPNFPASYYAPGKSYMEGPQQVCAGEPQRYYVVGNCAAVDYAWEVMNGEILQQQGDSAWVQFNASGEQLVIVHRTTACAAWSDTLRVQVEGGLAANDTLYICPGDSVEIFGQWVSQSGSYSQSYASAAGCDSIVLATVALLPGGDTTQLSVTSCNPADVGVFVQALANQFYCDSTVVTTVTFSPADSTWLSSTTCDPSAAGIFTSVFVNQFGCDSVVTETLSLLTSDSTFLFSTTCDPSAAGVFSNVFNNQFGCDSIVTETVSLLPGDTVFLSSTTCDPSAAGVFTNIFTNQFGCDSIVTETRSLLPGDTVFLSSTTCDPSAAGVFTNIFTNQFGCDSSVVETAVLLAGDTTFLIFTTCDPAQTGTEVNVFPASGGCDSVVVAVTTLAEPLTVDLGEDRHIAPGDNVALEAIVNVPFDSLTSIAWYPPVCPACVTQVVSPSQTTTYSVSIVAVNECSAEDEVTVFVERLEQVYVPTAFSPNGDGINDRLTVYGTEGTMVQLFRIFDRWGEMVFEASGFPVNDESVGWDGVFKGKAMTSGVFVWFAEVQFPNGSIEIVKGDSTLVR